MTDCPQHAACSQTLHWRCAARQQRLLWPHWLLPWVQGVSCCLMLRWHCAARPHSLVPVVQAAPAPARHGALCSQALHWRCAARPRRLLRPRLQVPGAQGMPARERHCAARQRVRPWPRLLAPVVQRVVAGVQGLLARQGLHWRRAARQRHLLWPHWLLPGLQGALTEVKMVLAGAQVVLARVPGVLVGVQGPGRGQMLFALQLKRVLPVPALLTQPRARQH